MVDHISDRIEQPQEAADGEMLSSDNSIKLAKARKIVAKQSLRAQQLFEFLVQHPYDTWKPGELAGKLGIGYRVLRRSALRLEKVGVLRIGGSRLNISFEIAGLETRPRRRQVPKHLQPVFKYLQRNCARKGGLYSCEQDDIAKALRMPVLTVVEHIGALRKEKFIGIIRHAYHNSYFIVGREPAHMDLTAVPAKPGWYLANSGEPSPLSIQGQILTLVRRRQARRGFCSLSRPQIATILDVSLTAVNDAMGELHDKELIIVISRGVRGRWKTYKAVMPAVASKRPHKGKPPAAAVPIKSRGGRPAEEIKSKVEELWNKLRRPKGLSYNQAKACFPKERVRAAINDPADRERMRKHANQVVLRLRKEA